MVGIIVASFGGLAVAAIWSIAQIFRSSKNKLPYPPGPPPTNVISGHASMLPPTHSWYTCTEWAKKYGDLLHCRIYNQHIVVVNSLDVANDLFEKRSRIYSDRPHAPITFTMGWDLDAAFLPYGNLWREHRRMYQQTFNPSASLLYRPLQAKKIHEALLNFLNTPEDFRNHQKTLAASIVFSTMYGYDVSGSDDHFALLAESAVETLPALSLFSGAGLVVYIPFLRYLPSWVPGASLNRLILQCQETLRGLRNGPFEWARKDMAAGRTTGCLVETYLDRCTSEMQSNILKDICATTCLAGMETSVAISATFFLAMAMFPDAQLKAQQEIDALLGSNADRLIDYDDRLSLPYVEALYREVLRWRPVTPLSLAHATSEDDIYNGYYIPKGAIAIANVWAITRDTRVYEDPESFSPERFFDENGDLNKDIIDYVFGFGRRICPGRHMGDASVWLTIATVLASFDIRKKKDEAGKEIPIDPTKYSGGLASHPLAFQCSITPRSDNARRIVIEATANKN